MNEKLILVIYEYQKILTRPKNETYLPPSIDEALTEYNRNPILHSVYHSVMQIVGQQIKSLEELELYAKQSEPPDYYGKDFSDGWFSACNEIKEKIQELKKGVEG